MPSRRAAVMRRSRPTSTTGTATRTGPTRFAAAGTRRNSARLTALRRRGAPRGAPRRPVTQSPEGIEIRGGPAASLHAATRAAASNHRGPDPPGTLHLVYADALLGGAHVILGVAQRRDHRDPQRVQERISDWKIRVLRLTLLATTHRRFSSRRTLAISSRSAMHFEKA